MPINIHDYPAISDLRARARRRMPHFAWEYLESGTGTDRAVARNREALDQVTMIPKALYGKYAPQLGVNFLGQDYAMPIGIAPVGGTSVIWPGAEKMLAHVAAQERVPVGLSTVATQTPEVIGPIAGDMGWRLRGSKPSCSPSMCRSIRGASGSGARGLTCRPNWARGCWRRSPPARLGRWGR